MKLEASARSDIGPVRQSNQDAVGCFPDRRLFLLSDGMGGLADGEVASRIAIDETSAQLVTANGHAGGSTLTDAIGAANRRLREEAKQRGERNQALMGATIVALQAFPEEGRVSWAHVGDSRLYRLRAGQLSLLTADHTVPGAAYRGATEIPLTLPHTNQLVQALGTADDIEPTPGAGDLHPGDVFLLCSDGVSGPMPPEQLVHELGRSEPVDALAERLVEGALAASGRDNASVILIRVQDD